MSRVQEIPALVQKGVKEFVSHPGLRWFVAGTVTTLLVTFVTISLRWKEYLVFNLISVGVVVVVVLLYLDDRGVVMMTPLHPCTCKGVDSAPPENERNGDGGLV